MDIFSIEVQPSADSDIVSLQAAYRPIYFEVLADVVVGTDQPMYADVYFKLDGSYVYYKTLTSYSISQKFVSSAPRSVFEFDIQDAAQEYLTTFVPQPLVSVITPANEYFYTNANGAVLTKVLFRGSTITDGLLTPNPTIPIQGTSTTDPVSGTGTASNVFNVIDATLTPDRSNDASGLNQPENILIAHVPFTPVESDQRIYGLSNMPVNFHTGDLRDLDYGICPEVYANDYGGFPVLIAQYGTYFPYSTTQRHLRPYLMYWHRGAALPNIQPLATTDLIQLGAFYVPSGMQEIAAALPSIAPALINQNNPFYYRVYLQDIDAGQTIFMSPVYRIMNTGIEQTRIWFKNYWGHFEQLSFVRNRASFKTASAEQFTPFPSYQQYPDARTQKTGRKRFNTRVQDELSYTGVFPEKLMPWVKELLGSPYCLLDGKGEMAPYKLSDDNYTVKKSVVEGRINYEITIRLIPAQDTIIQRN